DRDGVDVLVLEDFADILEGARDLLILLIQPSDVLLGLIGIHVHQRGELDILLRRPRLHVARAASAVSDYGYADRVVWPVLAAKPAAGNGRRRAHKEVSAIH